jgi:hypothetical protein
MKKQICQSCGIPLENNNFGTNADSSPNKEYCKFCYKAGEFVLPALTLETQIERLSEMAVKNFSMSKIDALKITNSTLPDLLRWQQN